MEKYIIIGNGVAAAGCIEGIRSVDKACEITVVSAEKYPVYCRPLISYYLENRTTLEKMQDYRPADFYEKNNCKVLYGASVTKLDNTQKVVTLDSGETLPYTKVCVAAGSSPFVPAFEGLENVEKKFSFMTIDDTLALEQAITPDAKVLIVGAGLIGLKCAEGLHGRVGKITVCDLAPRILSSILDDECAGMMQKHLEANGIEFLLSDSAVKFESGKALMKSGKEVSFDVLVLAVGVRANISLVKDAGGNVNRGILVSEKSETSLPDVYAAGDCTEGMDISFGQNRVLAILPNAYMQGKCAGVNMAGGEAVFDNAIPMNSIGFFGFHVMTAGSYFGAEDGGSLYEERTEESIKRLYTKGDLLTGFILLGCTDRAGIYTSLIRNKTPLSSFDFESMKKSPAFTSFSKEYRGNKLGGVV